ncbi:MAG: VWA domain-containing protein [Deltaproteobacteria bacterium]|nr:VWA domain-containing protein [Deltaproteobacteria bacterium]
MTGAMGGGGCGILAGVLAACLAGCTASNPFYEGGDGTGDAGHGDGRADSDGGPLIDCSFDPRCNGICASDGDCGAHLYCGSGFRCQAECSPGGSECPAGWSCEQGRCLEDCPSIVVDLTPVTPTVMLLIDQSGSMTEDFLDLTRWEAVDEALTDPADGVLPALESDVLFGASLYTSHNGSLGGEACPLLQTVTPALGTAGAIDALLRDNDPDGDTPTGEAIVATTATLTATPPGPDDGPRIIVLATDGEPDTCEVPNPQEGQDEAVAAAQAAWAAGVDLFVLSVGSDVGEPHLQDMANAGAGLPIDGPTDAPFYVANDPAELAAAFDAITRPLRTCTFTLDGEVDPADWDAGDVRLDGAPLAYETPDGWVLTDGHTLVLQGAACTAFLGPDEPVLTAEWPCGTIIG